MNKLKGEALTKRFRDRMRSAHLNVVDESTSSDPDIPPPTRIYRSRAKPTAVNDENNPLESTEVVTDGSLRKIDKTKSQNLNLEKELPIVSKELTMSNPIGDATDKTNEDYSQRHSRLQINGDEHTFRSSLRNVYTLKEPLIQSERAPRIKVYSRSCGYIRASDRSDAHNECNMTEKQYAHSLSNWKLFRTDEICETATAPVGADTLNAMHSYCNNTPKEPHELRSESDDIQRNLDPEGKYSKAAHILDDLHQSPSVSYFSNDSSMAYPRLPASRSSGSTMICSNPEYAQETASQSMESRLSTFSGTFSPSCTILQCTEHSIEAYGSLTLRRVSSLSADQENAQHSPSSGKEECYTFHHKITFHNYETLGSSVIFGERECDETNTDIQEDIHFEFNLMQFIEEIQRECIENILCLNHQSQRPKIDLQNEQQFHLMESPGNIDYQEKRSADRSQNATFNMENLSLLRRFERESDRVEPKILQDVSMQSTKAVPIYAEWQKTYEIELEPGREQNRKSNEFDPSNIAAFTHINFFTPDNTTVYVTERETLRLLEKKSASVSNISDFDNVIAFKISKIVCTDESDINIYLSTDMTKTVQTVSHQSPMQTEPRSNQIKPNQNPEQNYERRLRPDRYQSLSCSSEKIIPSTTNLDIDHTLTSIKENLDSVSTSTNEMKEMFYTNLEDASPSTSKKEVSPFAKYVKDHVSFKLKSLISQIARATFIPPFCASCQKSPMAQFEPIILIDDESAPIVIEKNQWTKHVEIIDNASNYLCCPDSTCDRRYFASELHSHFSNFHEQITHTNICLNECANFNIDPNAFFITTRASVVFHVSDMLINSQCNGEMNPMVVAVMTTRTTWGALLNKPKAKNNASTQRTTEKSAIEEEMFMCWLTGILPERQRVSVTLCCWSASPEYQRTEVISSNLYDVRRKQNASYVFKHGNCILLPLKEVIRMTDGMQKKLPFQMCVK